MKQLLLATLFVATACQIGEKEFPWSDASLEAVLQDAGSRLVLVEFFTDW